VADLTGGVLITHAAALVGFAALLCIVMIVALRPLLLRYALARPNARSSHKIPTPQGGGIAVMTATVAVSVAGLLYLDIGAAALSLPAVFTAVVVIAGMGMADDIRPLGVLPRLLLQGAAVATVIFTLPADLHIVPILPWWIERSALVIGGAWFVNLVNFMDGLDWMTAAEVIPVTVAIAAIGYLGPLPPQAIVVSLALCGAMVGFAFFNRPAAKLFLGDVGSLPIGLTLGWLLVLLAGHGNRVAALLLPLYYLSDSTITLLRRLFSGERVWQAHRSHFYQRATDRGFTVIEVVSRVFIVNLALAALAFLTVTMPSRTTESAALIAGILLVAWLLWTLSRGRVPQ